MSAMLGRAAFAAACATVVFGTPVRAGAGSLAPAKASDVAPASPNQFRSAGLTVVDPVPSVQPAVPSALDGAIADAFGVAVGSSEIPDGFVVKPPAVLYVTLPDGVGETGTIVVNGFLARSK